MSVTWGNSSEGDFMKMLLWVLVLYEGAIGAVELYSGLSSTAGNSSTVSSITSAPTVGSLVTGAGGTTASGGVDLGVAAAIWYFGLR
jgi:hypothetical protein